jgi:serine/threonine-protein kinase
VSVPEPDGAEAEAAPWKVCVQCRSRFSGDARFCPFDGEPLSVDHATRDDPLLGTVIDGRYEVLAILGEGGMGRVYRVRHRSIERLFALKALRADLASDSDLGLRFTREAKAAASISHPNVVQITDFGTLPGGQPYFVMELLPGHSLSSVISAEGPLPVDRGVRLMAQIVDALAAAHRAGVVHRDLKPDNIVICQTGRGGETAKVLDFGLAQVAGQSRLTRGGLTFGTPQYMSPEQASGGPVDERTDIYALGVVMYQTFTGRVPFEGDTYMGVLTQHVYVEPSPPSVLLGRPGLGAVEQLIMRCLEKKPERRFASMDELREDLARVARFEPDGTLRLLPVEPQEPPRRRSDPPLTSAEMRVVKAERPRGVTRSALLTFGAVTLLVALVLLSLRGMRITARESVEPSHGGVSSGSTASRTEVSPSPSAADDARGSASVDVRAGADAPGLAASASPGSDHALDTGGSVPRGAPVRPAASARNHSQLKKKSSDDAIVDPWGR